MQWALAGGPGFDLFLELGGFSHFLREAAPCGNGGDLQCRPAGVDGLAQERQGGLDLPSANRRDQGDADFQGRAIGSLWAVFHEILREGGDEMLDARLDLLALGWGPLVLKAKERVQSGAGVEFIEILRCELVEHGADDGLPVWIFWGQRIRRQY